MVHRLWFIETTTEIVIRVKIPHKLGCIFMLIMDEIAIVRRRSRWKENLEQDATAGSHMNSFKF